MRRKSYVYLAALLIAVLLYVLFPTDKKRIHKVIGNCSEAIIKEDINQIMEHISFNYRDDYGGSYLALKKRAEMVFVRFSDFEITADVMKITVDKERAEAHLKVSIIATEDGRRGYFIGDAEKAGDIRVFLEKSPYEWKVIKVERVEKSNNN